MSVEVGQEAPDFALRDQDRNIIRLSDYRGTSRVVLVFYPFAFSRICTGELCAMRDDFSAFEGDDVVVLGISCDHFFSQAAYREKEGYPFSLLSDYWPHGEVARAYGVFDEKAGCAVRGTFVIGTDGIVTWKVVNGIGEARDLGAYQEALAATA